MEVKALKWLLFSIKDTSQRLSSPSFEQTGRDGAQAHGWSPRCPRWEPARDRDPLGPSCAAGDGANEPLPAVPAPVTQEGWCQALLQGARHVPGLIGTWCPQVTPASASSPSSLLLRKSTHGNGRKDDKRHGGSFPTLPPRAPHPRSSLRSREPWGDLILEGDQERWCSPAGPGHTPHSSHPAPLGRADGIPWEGWHPLGGMDGTPAPASTLTHRQQPRYIN